MAEAENVNDLQTRLSTLSPAQRAWLEQRLRTSIEKKPIGKKPAKVVELQAGVGELPVYFIYAGPDEIRLAQMMGGDHPVFGIEMPWPLAWRNAVANNDTAALPTMEQLVAPFVAALSTHVRSSPCVLAGYSFAGVMAFEAAHQFQELGGNVEMVILIDTWTKPPPPAHVAWWNFQQSLKQTLDRLPARRWVHAIASGRGAWFVFSLMWRTKKWILRIFRHRNRDDGGLTSFLDEQGVPLTWELVVRLYRKTIKSYDLRPLNCRGILFKTNEEFTHLYDNRLAWKGLFAKGLEIVSAPGDHHAMIREKPYTLALARKMTELLKRHSTSKGASPGS